MVPNVMTIPLSYKGFDDMLDVLTDGFKNAKNRLQGKATLNEENITVALEDVRKSLLEADVEYSVTKTFLGRVKSKALGLDVTLKAGSGQDRLKVTAGDHFIKICQEELESLMGPESFKLNFPTNRPGKVMMVGLQGVGKTTTTGKLAHYFKNQLKKKPLLVAADIYRPAAADQLRVLADKIGVPVFHILGAKPEEICLKAEAKAYELGCDLILYDTAGRLAIDDELMNELSTIKRETKPDHILLVCDAMMGQDAVSTAKSFHERLDLSAFIMSKMDGDARGGAALSVKEITGRPIAFIGAGEGLDRLEEFRPQGLASRILGMGDVVGLMEDFSRVSNADREEEALRMLEGKFSFRDFYEQISMIQKMGSLKDIIAKLPMQNLIPKGINVDETELLRIKSMIDSMTEKERLNPNLLNDSRIKRIAKGSGNKPKDVSELVNRFKVMRGIMGNFGKMGGLGGLMGKIPGMGGLGQLNDMRKMAQQMMGGGGMPGMSGPTGATPVKRIDKDKLKKVRKEAAKKRKANRKK